MKQIAVLLMIAACVVQTVSVNHDDDDACLINQCQCSRSSNGPYDDVKCFLNSITSSDDTIKVLPSGVQSLILSCSSPVWLSFLSTGIFEKFSNLKSLTVEQCNIFTMTAESFRGLTSLTNLSIYQSVLPTLHQDTLKHVLNLQRLNIVNCNMTIFPDIFHLKSLGYLNFSHNNISHIEVVSQTFSDKGISFAEDNSGKGTNLTESDSDNGTNLTEGDSGNGTKLIEGDSGKGTNLTEGHSTDSSERNDLAELKIFDLSFNNIGSLPVGLLERTPHLQELYLIGLSLTQLVIPDKIRLKDLIILDASMNRLQAVNFHSISISTNMKVLRLEGTGFPMSCHGLSYLVNLEELALNNFNITETIWQVLNSSVLTRLNLINNSLTTVDISALPMLKVLQLARNRISFLSSLSFRNQHNLLFVNFSDNNIESLPTDLFHSNSQIVVIDFAGNFLKRLGNGTFRGLNKMRYLDLQNNLLSYLPYTIFEDLSSMMYLFLSGNRIRSLPDLSYMTGLYTLEVKNNQLATLVPQQLEGLDKLESLVLNDNNLKVLPPNLFIECPNLLQVYLDNNQITDLGSLDSHPKLAILTLNNNQLTDFIAESPFVRLTNLQFLDLSSNNFTSLTANTFPSSIVTLFLDRNSIQLINSDTFNGLSRLSYVSLRGNYVVLSFSLKTVSVFKMNSPKPTFDVERNVFLCDCTLSYLKVISENRTSIRVFQMYYPKFLGLDNSLCYTPFWGQTFRPFTQVPLSQFVCDYTDTVCDVYCDCCNLNTTCDCLLTCPSECKCLIGGSGFSTNYVGIMCSNSNLHQVPAGIPSRTTLLYLDGNKLSHLSKENFSYLRKVEEIYLNNSAIESIEMGAFNDIPQLKMLVLNDNLLTKIPENLFGNISKIKELYLHNNLINSVSEVAFLSLPSLDIITLHNNKLVLLTSVPQLPRQLSMTLSGNPWSCDCNVSKVIIRTVYELSQVIQDADKMCCIVSNGSLHSLADAGVLSFTSPGDNQNARNATVTSTRDTAGTLSDKNNFTIPSNIGQPCFLLLRFSYEDFCRLSVSNSSVLILEANTDLHPGFIALIVITIILLLVASAVVLVLFKRQEIQAWVFVKTGVRVLDKKEKLDKEDADSKMFDAFISHSSADVGFVAGTLAPALENGDKKYRLCIHYRDFPVGRNITDTICKAIENSSRTILLLSVHFLNSEWCRFEFQTAHHHILSQGSHRLILILLEDIPEDLLDPDLKVHMKSNTYLKYKDPWFWEKLHFAMPSIEARQEDKDTRRLDVLCGMRFLAGDEHAADQANNENQENDIRLEFGSEA